MNGVIFANAATITLVVIAATTVIVSWFIRQRIISSIFSIVSYVCALACVSWGLLLGANMNEVIIVILLLLALNIVAFIPEKSQAHSSEITDSPSEKQKSELNAENPDKENAQSVNRTTNDDGEAKE